MKRLNKLILTIGILVSLASIPFISYQKILPIEVSAQTEITESVPVFIQNDGEPCGVRFNVEQKIEKERRFKGDMASRGANARIITGGVIPVYWTVLHLNDGTGNLTDQQIADSIALANQSFSKTGWQFVLAGVNRRLTTTFLFQRGSSPAFRISRDKLNIVTFDLPAGVYGFSTSAPPIFGSTGDYIAFDYKDVIPNPTVSGQWTHTIPHEIGHWMGLDHTFFYECDKPDDFVDDTPATLLTYGCPVRSDTCRPTREMNPSNDPGRNFEYGGLDPIHNFMGYNDDSCTNEFTRGQDQRMDEMFTLYRAGQ